MFEVDVNKVLIIIALIIAVLLIIYSLKPDLFVIQNNKQTAGEGYTPPAPAQEFLNQKQEQNESTGGEQQVELYELRVFRIKQVILNGEKVDYSYVVLKSPMPIKLAPGEVGVVFNGQDERVLKVKEVKKGDWYYYVIYFQVHKIKSNSTLELFWMDKHFTLTLPVQVESENSSSEGESVNVDNYFDLLEDVRTVENQNITITTASNNKILKGIISAMNNYVFSTNDDARLELSYALISGSEVIYYTDLHQFKVQAQETLVRAEGFRYDADSHLVTVRRETFKSGNSLKVFVEVDWGEKSFKRTFTVSTVYSLMSKTIAPDSDNVYMLVDKYLILISPQGVKSAKFTTRTGLLTAFLFKDSQGNPVLIWSDGERTYYVKYSADLTEKLSVRSWKGRLVRAGWFYLTGLLKFKDRYRIYAVIQTSEGFKTLLLNQEYTESDDSVHVIVGDDQFVLPNDSLIIKELDDALIPVRILNDENYLEILLFKPIIVKNRENYIMLAPYQSSPSEFNLILVVIKQNGISEMFGGDDITSQLNINLESLYKTIKIELKTDSDKELEVVDVDEES